MPIYQADLDHERLSRVAEPPIAKTRRLSEESIRTELCDGPLLDSSSALRSEDEATITSRDELIQRIKRGESPTWRPNRHLESVLKQSGSISPVSRPSSACSNLLPPAQITPEKNERISPVDSRLRDGLSIERPRSALHRGDFTREDAPVDKSLRKVESEPRRQTSSPWLATSPPRDFMPFQFNAGRVDLQGQSRVPSYSSLSSSLSSSFAYQPPTSPLVQSESNEELDLSRPMAFSSERMFSRRHTLHSNRTPPHVSPSYYTSLSSSHHHRPASLPYQAHQPRRSLTSKPNFLSSATPSRPRRPSFGSESLQHASMVGSYEESILRGRMSTTPSKPLDFLAQIGVLGMGNCKASLKCPSHVTLPFPAVYYSYSSTPHGRSRTDDGPSPYVGQVDLENGLPNLSDESRSKRKAQTRRRSVDAEAIMGSQPEEARKPSRSKRRSASPRAPPGGSYRIPEKGQLQIIIKNQNKTAVKLFLVPYDLAGMEPGTKTFIRQRSYSAGPIIDCAVPTNLDRPILRYLIHLHICCPAKGRFYLYKSIRVVFANRVPDGKEKLRNETTWPEPRYSPYKSIRVMHPPSSSGPGAMLAADKAFRRRSSGYAMGPSSQAFEMMDCMYPASAAGVGNGNTLPVDPIPLRLPPCDRPGSGTSDGDSEESYAKLSKGDIGYGGNLFTPPSPVGGAAGLLSQRLRGLWVKPEES